MINIGGNEIKQVQLGSTPISEIWIGNTKLWPSTPPTPQDAWVLYRANMQNAVALCSDSANWDVQLIANDNIVVRIDCWADEEYMGTATIYAGNSIGEIVWDTHAPETDIEVDMGSIVEQGGQGYIMKGVKLLKP